ncbi:hypothetical protein K431DRAFT_346488 [Polychaeton citri CBS 116435]|uniref:Uncharacterized protein n=1 Tax=Polychaeton citri CBS 116435 TaxID=1314669 RepID=A0A9P4UPV0_9PEZI|nr:hypothetical protein K431DRAFT_346488 [Polychaeton citri CBS 116435]
MAIMDPSTTFSDITTITASAMHAIAKRLDNLIFHIFLDLLLIFILACLLSPSPFHCKDNQEMIERLRSKICVLRDEIDILNFGEKTRDKRIKELENGENKLFVENAFLCQFMSQHNSDRDMHDLVEADSNRKISALKAQLAATNQKIAEVKAEAAQSMADRQDQHPCSRCEAQAHMLQEAAADAQKARDAEIAEHDAEIHAINKAAETKVKAASEMAWKAASALLGEVRSELETSEAVKNTANSAAATWRREAESLQDQVKEKADLVNNSTALLTELRLQLRAAEEQLRNFAEQASIERTMLIQDAEKAYEKKMEEPRKHYQQTQQPEKSFREQSTETFENKITVLNKALGDKTTQVFKLEAKMEEGKKKLKRQISLLQEQIKRARDQIEEVNEDSMCKGEELREFADRADKQRTQIRDLRTELAMVTAQRNQSHQSETQQRLEIAELNRRLEENRQLDLELLNASDEEMGSGENHVDDHDDDGGNSDDGHEDDEDNEYEDNGYEDSGHEDSGHEDNGNDYREEGDSEERAMCEEAYDFEQDAEADSDHEHE